MAKCDIYWSLAGRQFAIVHGFARPPGQLWVKLPPFLPVRWAPEGQNHQLFAQVMVKFSTFLAVRRPKVLKFTALSLSAGQLKLSRTFFARRRASERSNPIFLAVRRASEAKIAKLG